MWSDRFENSVHPQNDTNQKKSNLTTNNEYSRKIKSNPQRDFVKI